jgi:hypothetical protein
MHDHNIEAQKNPIPYQGTITIGDKTLSIIDAANAQNDMPPIIQRFGHWAVCSDGSVQCLYTYYFISKERLDELDWEKHISEKTWAHLPDFSMALNAAKALR